MSKVIPVTPYEQVTAKLLHSYIISLMGITTASIVAILVLHLKTTVLAAATGLAMVIAFVLTAVGMIIDLARPLLDWTNPQKAIKQNLNVLFALLADIGILTVLGFIIYFLIKAGVAAASILVVLFIILAALSWGSFHFLFKFAQKRYAEIEV